MTKKIAIVADLHGKSAVLKKLMADVFPTVSEIWWLGDLFYSYKKDEASITESSSVMSTLLAYKDKPSVYVMGNTDSMDGFGAFAAKFEPETVVKKVIGTDKIILTHGHLHETREALINLAKDNEAQIVISGHTHLPLLAIEDDILLVNPGSPAIPRDEEATPTYILFNPENKQFQLIHFPTGKVLNELYYS